ncbi:hypothetical protein EVG20_g7611 [Dentipellis fragilis]|uniref:Uncharacterized protein n=1 Tax=Dentipellis fragilis TaxID=205917 RepID=A0A4Y9YDY7_9AGAM|nr:hypothetical protein EVG20_g7611 [Dentipellis fragilis]
MFGYAVVINAAPLQRRQTGDVQCNIDRLKVVVGMQETLDSVNQLSTQLGCNTSFASNITTAQTGIHGAQVATDEISQAIFANQTADPDLRQQFAGNITMVLAALQAIEPTDSTSNATLTQALTSLNGTAAAGNDVVADCH